MTTQYSITDEYGLNSSMKYVVHDTEILNIEARLATSLIERWGMVAAIPDGEDSTGRAKLRCMTPAEIATRASETADAAMADFRNRGWIVAGPDVSELSRKVED